MASVKEQLASLTFKYCKWIAENPGLSKELETGFKLSTYIISHLLSKSGTTDSNHQIIYSLSEIVSFFNDAALSKACPRVGLPYGNNLKTWLTLVEYCEISLEIASQRKWGPQGKWTAIVLVQLFKCFARIALVTRSNEGLLPTPTIPPLKRETVVETEYLGTQNNRQTLRLGSGVVIRGLDSRASFNTTPQSADLDSIIESTNTYSFQGLSLLSEILHATKPLIHLGAIRLTGRNSWTQWMTSLLLELASIRLQWSDFALKRFNREQRWQYLSRVVGLLLYLLKSPFYNHFAKSAILTVLLTLRRMLPFLKIILDPAIDFLPVWHETYFYLWSR